MSPVAETTGQGGTRGRLLYLQNGTKRKTVSRLDERFAAAGLTVDSFWAYQGEYPDSLEPYSGVFISGSPHGAYEDIDFIHRQHDLIVEIAARGLPTLGICFGSQILASALCGRDQVFRRSFCEVGYKWLPLSAARAGDTLMEGLGDRVEMFVWHNDEVRADHGDMTILASSDLCPNQIWRYRDLPIWGIQGHPEITLAQSRVWFEENRERLEKDGADVERLHESAVEAEEAKTMLSNFVRLCGAA